MPRYIIKPHKGIDLYAEWSTVVDNVCRIGSRSDFLNEGEPAERMDRADATGTSVLGFDHEGDGFTEYGWDDEKFIVAKVREPYGMGWLPRERLLEYVRAYQDDDAERAEALLEPLEEE